jgi:hypothetical protein
MSSRHSDNSPMLIKQAAARRWLHRRHTVPAARTGQQSALVQATKAADWDAAADLINAMRCERRRGVPGEATRLLRLKAREQGLLHVLGELATQISALEQQQVPLALSPRRGSINELKPSPPPSAKTNDFTSIPKVPTRPHTVEAQSSPRSLVPTRPHTVEARSSPGGLTAFR